MKNGLNWLESDRLMAGDRVLCIADEAEGYFAEVPAGMKYSEAVDDFVSTYNFDDDDDTSREAQEEWLRRIITVRVREAR